MRLLHFFACVMFGLALIAMNSDAQTKGAKDNDKTEVSKKLVVGKLKEINLTKMQFGIVTESGKVHFFTVNKETKFIGPKGGISEDGLKDDRMAKGNVVKVLPAKDKKTAAEVHLPVRKSKGTK
jgi:hypothetical protein